MKELELKARLSHLDHPAFLNPWNEALGCPSQLPLPPIKPFSYLAKLTSSKEKGRSCLWACVRIYITMSGEGSKVNRTQYSTLPPFAACQKWQRMGTLAAFSSLNSIWKLSKREGGRGRERSDSGGLSHLHQEQSERVWKLNQIGWPHLMLVHDVLSRPQPLSQGNSGDG